MSDTNSSLKLFKRIFEFPLLTEVRLVLFFIFLALIAAETYLVLHIEQEIADHEGFYSKRIHPNDSKVSSSKKE